MCNKRHPDGVPIKKRGKGWKIFEVTPNSFYDNIHKERDIYTMISRDRIFFDEDGVVRYRKEKGGWEDGFCFFLKKKEAERCLKGWLMSFNCLLKQIYYYEGIERHQEDGIYHGKEYEIALCKSYRILD